MTFSFSINAWWEPLTFTVPADLPARQWIVVCDTHDPERSDAVGHEVTVGQRSMVVLHSQT